MTARFRALSRGDEFPCVHAHPAALRECEGGRALVRPAAPCFSGGLPNGRLYPDSLFTWSKSMAEVRTL